VGQDTTKAKPIIGTERLLALLETLEPEEFLEAVEGGLCVYSKATGRLVKLVRFFEEEITVLHEE